jgi:putative CocE/NonD family hydrolase
MRIAVAVAAAAATLALPVVRADAAAPPTVPAPTFSSVSQEVLVTMDDGVKLAGTVALPSRDGQTPAAGRFPVVLSTTPYSRTGVCGCIAPSFWATRGMVGAVFDVRGTGGSGGNLEGNFFSPREARDGAALVENLGTRPYSTGKVGMAGGSYLGITQYLAAEQSPPHLAAITPAVSISDLYREGFAHGGIPSLSFDLQYIAVQGAPGAAGANTDPFLLAETLSAKLGQSPPGTIAFDYLSRPNDDAFYRDRSPIYRAEQVKVPALIIGGWRDGLLRGAPEMYQRLARRRRVETRLYIDPCSHKGCGAPFAPFNDPPGREDLLAVAFEFLDKHLRGAKTPARPRVRYYLQARNAFVDADRWPPGGTGSRRVGLGAGTRSYVTNPSAGFSLAFNKYGTVAATPFVPTDQRLEGPQGLTYRTPALDSALDVIGPTALRLVASSTASDTDWHAKLSDVAPDGSETLITEGALRASHRALDRAKSTPLRPYHPHVNPQPIVPNRFYAYDVEIEPTAYRVARGHQLQLRLTSTDLPTHLPGSFAFDRNRPQDVRVDLNQPATNSVRLQDSYLSLPAAGRDGGGIGVCLARRSPIGPRNIGRIRLGYTRARMLRVPVRRPRRTQRTLRYCVKRSRGRVTAVFGSRSLRARAKLVVTTAAGHGNRRVRVGSKASRFRRSYPNRVRIDRGLYRARRGSPRLFGVRRGRVRFIAVASRRVALRRYLRIAGLR